MDDRFPAFGREDAGNHGHHDGEQYRYKNPQDPNVGRDGGGRSAQRTIFLPNRKGDQIGAANSAKGSLNLTTQYGDPG
jgi:hypothetical protein